jgi:cytochrome c-type biogenesis protein CcmH
MEIIQIMQIILLIIVILVVVFFIYNPPKSKNTDENKSNAEIGKRKLKELENDLKNNLISDDDFKIAKDEISQNLAMELLDNTNEDKNTKKPHLLAVFIVIFMIVVSYFTYESVKSEPTKLPQNTIEILENNVKRDPQDSKSWQMLGFSYSLDGKIEKAKNSYEKSYDLGNKDIDLLTEYASTLATIAGGDFAGKPATLVREALELDSKNVKALYLAGIIAANAGMLELSKGLWQKALSFSEAGSSDEKMLVDVLAQLEAFENEEKQAKTSVQISVSVDITEEIYKKHAGSFIMIYAKNATGRPMPIAIVKMPLDDFNGVVNLSDENSVMPNTKLSDATEIIVVARISATGSAMKQAGDIETFSKVIKNGSQNVELNF